MSTTLPEPIFIETDVETITQDLVKIYEDAAEKTLQPAQSERLMIDLIAYVQNLVNISINEAAKQNLVTYATYPMLDELAKFVAEKRLQPQYAKTTIRILMSQTKEYDVDFPADLEIESKDGEVIFKTLTAGTISAGDLYVDVEAQCTTAGIIGNGYLPGEINKPLFTSVNANSFENTITTSGGAELEGEEAFRLRIFEAPEKLTIAGSKGAYKALTKAAHQDIIDVAVIKPQDPSTISYNIDGTDYNATAEKDPEDEYAGIFTGTLLTSGSVDYRSGQMVLNFDEPVSSISIEIPPADLVEIYLLTKDGNPTSVIKELVEEALDPDTKIPMMDNRQIKDPVAVDFVESGTLTVLQGYEANTVKSNVEAKLNEYNTSLKTSFKKDIIPAQITAQALSVEGVYNFVLSTPSYITLKDNEWANGSVGEITTEVYSG